MYRTRRSKSMDSVGTARLALAFGAVAVGAFAVGALAIGRLAIGRLLVKDLRIKSLAVDDLTVLRLHAAEVTVADSLQLPDAAPLATQRQKPSTVKASRKSRSRGPVNPTTPDSTSPATPANKH